MNKKSLIFASLIFMLVTGSASAMHDVEVTSPERPTPGQIAMHVGIRVGLGFLESTIAGMYNVFLQQGSFELYQKMRHSNHLSELKFKPLLPERDDRIVLPENVMDLIMQMKTWEFPAKYVDAPSLEVDQTRRHMLLHGEPGLGKTVITKQMAAHMGAYYLDLNASDVKNDNFRGVFQYIRTLGKKAYRQKKYLFVNFDEMSVWRTRFTKEVDKNPPPVDALLPEILKLPENIVILGTTNNKYVIDTALLDRFKEQVKMDLPSIKERILILDRYLHCFNVKGAIFKHLQELSERLEGFTGRSLSDLVTKAEANRKVSRKDAIDDTSINAALRSVLPDRLFEIQRQITSNNTYLGKQDYEAHHAALTKDNESLKSRHKILTKVLDSIKDEKEKGKEKVDVQVDYSAYDNDKTYEPTKGLKAPKKPSFYESYLRAFASTRSDLASESQTPKLSFYEKYLAAPASMGSYIFNSKPAFAMYGGLTIGVAAFTLIKAGLINTSPH